MWKLQCGFLWTISVVQPRYIYIYSIFILFFMWERLGQGCCLWQSGKFMSNRFYGLYLTCSATLNCWNVSVQALWSSVCNLFCGSRNTYIFFKPLSHFSILKCPVSLVRYAWNAELVHWVLPLFTSPCAKRELKQYSWTGQLQCRTPRCQNIKWRWSLIFKVLSVE